MHGITFCIELHFGELCCIVFLASTVFRLWGGLDLNLPTALCLFPLGSHKIYCISFQPQMKHLRVQGQSAESSLLKWCRRQHSASVINVLYKNICRMWYRVGRYKATASSIMWLASERISLWVATIQETLDTREICKHEEKIIIIFCFDSFKVLLMMMMVGKEAMIF